jgi:hypothetical protein
MYAWTFCLPDGERFKRGTILSEHAARSPEETLSRLIREHADDIGRFAAPFFVARTS